MKDEYPGTKRESWKKDFSFYAEYDEDTAFWCVFGTETGFCYGTYCGEAEASVEASRLDSIKGSLPSLRHA